MKKVGRYLLLDLIAEGGSAEVFRALEDRGQGIQRLVALKCILKELATDVAFRRFFLEETKVSLGLSHPNIVQTYDFGEEQGRPYIVFEYVHGKSLKQVADRVIGQKQRLPVALSVFIAEQAARALHYAHTFKDPIKDQQLCIVHRDLSPHNLVVSYEGVPKLIDFGIAKVLQRDDVTQTSAGMIKGKPSYLSPEQVKGDPLDGRCDVFALGIVLWEILTGKRLFAGLSHAATMDLIADGATPLPSPSTHNPDVPLKLDTIVAKALERDRDRRFQSARELQAELQTLLGAEQLDTYSQALSSLLGGLFPEEIAAEKTHLRELLETTSSGPNPDPSWIVPEPAKQEEKSAKTDSPPTETVSVPKHRELVLPPVDSNAGVSLAEQPPKRPMSVTKSGISQEMRMVEGAGESPLRITGIEREVDETTFHVEGVVDEHADMLRVFDRLTTKVCLNLRGVSRMNSQGVKVWLNYFRHCHEMGAKVRYTECSPAVTHFLETFKRLGAVTGVSSVFAPFSCKECNGYFEYLVQTPDFTAIKAQLVGRKCPACRGELVLAEFAEQYFSFLAV